MPEKNGSFRTFIKVGLTIAILAGGAFAVMFALRRAAVVKPVELGLAVDGVPGSVEVRANGDLREFKTRVRGIVAACDLLIPDAAFKADDVLVQLDTSELDREVEQAKHNRETEQRRFAVEFAGNERWIAAKAKLDAARKALEAGTGSHEEVMHAWDEWDLAIFEAHLDRKDALKAVENTKRDLSAGRASQLDLEGRERQLKAVEDGLRVAAFDRRRGAENFQTWLETKELERDRMSIKAPADGVIKDVFAWKGALLNEGQTVATYFSNDRIVVAKISEEDFAKVRVGQSARVRLLSYPDREFDATVAKILSIAEEDTQRYTLHIEIPPTVLAPEKLIPFSTGEVTITVGARENRPQIERRALLPGGNEVFVVRDGRVERRPVELGFKSSLNLLEITSGLEPGELVIVEDLDLFQAGQRVRTEMSK